LQGDFTYHIFGLTFTGCVPTLELYRYHFLPIMPIPSISDYWNSQYGLWGWLFAWNSFSQIVCFWNTDLLLQCTVCTNVFCCLCSAC